MSDKRWDYFGDKDDTKTLTLVDYDIQEDTQEFWKYDRRVQHYRELGYTIQQSE